MGRRRPLLACEGACHGVGLRLEEDKLPFGAVTEHSTLTRRLQLSNVGDVGRRFSWAPADPAALAQHFSIEPESGFISTHGTQQLVVQFHPQSLSNDIRFERVPCLVDGQQTDGMYLTLSGACVPAPVEGAEEKRFEAPARGSTTQELPGR
jgi:hydrocephalus-inducing protein